jgi:hypothetical protein
MGLGIGFGADGHGLWASVTCGACEGHQAIRPIAAGDTHLVLVGELLLQAHQTGWSLTEAGLLCWDCSASQGAAGGAAAADAIP